MSDLKIPKDLMNVLDDLKANQKRPKPDKREKDGVFLKSSFPSFVASVSLAGEVLTKKKVIPEEVLVVEDLMEVSMVDKEVLYAVLVEENTMHNVAAAPICRFYRRYILRVQVRIASHPRHLQRLVSRRPL